MGNSMSFIKPEKGTDSKFHRFEVFCDDRGHEWSWINYPNSPLDYRPRTHKCPNCESECVNYRKIA